MSLENNIKDVIAKKLEEGFIENIIAEQLESGVKNALKDLLGTYGDVTKVIEKQVKSVMIPYLESYDYSKYIVKLDSVLVDVLNSSALENKKIIDNFKNLIVEEKSKSIKATDLFEQWKNYVSKNVDTDNLEICYEDDVTYESVEVNMTIDYNEERSWSSFEHAILVFECDHDEEMNFEVKIHRWKDHDREWTIDYKTPHDINSLRHLSEFEVYLMKLAQNYTRLELDSDYESDDVEPDERPEPSYS